MINNFRNNWLKKLFIGIVISLPLCLFSQDDKQAAPEENVPATIKLKLVVEDSIKTCKAIITAGDKPLEGIQVKFFVKRFFGSLPLIANGKAVSTDETGVASVKFPNDLPGDANGTVIVSAKVEDDDNYGTFEAKDSIKWGTIVSITLQEDEWNERSLVGSGNKAPVYLIMTAGVIIIIVWGTLLYVIYTLFKIKKAGKVKKV